jgi:hypothetical protein
VTIVLKSFVIRLNKSWLHFIVLGVVFYNVQIAMFPEPKIVIGPLHASRIDTLQQQWLNRFGREPSAAQKQKMIANELERDLLFQHALSLELHRRDKIVYDQLIRNMHFLNMAEGKDNSELFQQALDMQLHLNDELVKRRLIEKVQNRLLSEASPIAPTEAQIRAEFLDRKEQFRIPARLSISHLFFNEEREEQIKSVVAEIQENKLDAKTARHLSALFMSGYEFHRQTPDQLSRHFGAQFVSELAQASPVAGQWLGPIRSLYGLHYVWVEAIEPARDASFEEVESQIRRDLEAKARAQALKKSIAALHNDYEVKM